MRHLTKKEKAIITALVQKYDPDGVLTVGKVLMELYHIICIKKHVPIKSELSCYSERELIKINVEYEYNPQTEFSRDFYEAILLLCYLVDEHFIILNYFSFNVKNDTLGECSKMLYLYNPQKGQFGNNHQNFFDVFPHKIWPLLNSTFIVTNALIDYAKDFKTIEQRNFDQQLEDANKKHNEQMKSMKKTLCSTRAAFVAALIPALIGVYSSFFDISIRELNDTIKEQKISNVTPVKISNDTLKLDNMPNNKLGKENIRDKK